MKVAVAICFLLFSLALGQFSQTRDQLASLPLTSTVNEDLHDEFSANALGNQVVNNDCREAFHPVSGVRVNSGKANGIYFSVEFTNILNGPVNFYVYDPLSADTIDILDNTFTGSSTFTGSVGTCSTTSTCRFDYYCDVYTTSPNLEVVVYTDDGISATEFIEYDITFTQYVEVVATIPATRTLPQTVAVADPFDGNNLGPANFIQYYHDLTTSIVERSESGTLFVEITDFDVATSGDGYVCISFGSVVATTNNLAGVSDIPLNNGELDPAGVVSPIDTPTGCPLTCGRGAITAGVGSIYVPIDGCTSLCDASDLWIGVRPPGTSTYSVNIVSKAADLIPVVTPLSVASPIEIGGQISNAACVVNDGDFSCEDYYTLSNLNTSPNAYLSVELYGLINFNSVTLFVSENALAGASTCAACGATTYTCTVNVTPNDEKYCNILIDSCDFPSTPNYVITVQSGGSDDTTQPSYYGLRVNSGVYTASSVDVFNGPASAYGSVLPKQYAHYVVDFSSYEVTSTSNFIAEMYPENPVDGKIAFAWNYDTLAGSGSCYENSGICTTDTTCSDYDGDNFIDKDLYSYPYTSSVSFCRFQFYGCNERITQKDFNYGYWNPGAPGNYVYYNFLPEDDSLGFRRAPLESKALYFSVWALDYVDYAASDVKFTLEFDLKADIPLYENVVVLGEVYNTEYTSQYVLNVPDDRSIASVLAIVDNVQNGGVVMYMRCGLPAGSCPCNDFDDLCSAYAIEPSGFNLFQGYFGGSCFTQVSMCQSHCRGNPIYISLSGVFPGNSFFLGNDNTYGFSKEHPTIFTLESFYHRTQHSEDLVSIEATRVGSVVSGSVDEVLLAAEAFIDPSTIYTEGKSFDFYSLSLANAGNGRESLHLKLDILNDYLQYGYNNIAGIPVNPNAVLDSTVGMVISKDYILEAYSAGFAENVAPASQCTFAACFADTGYTGYSQSIGSNFGSSCSIVLEPCTSGCSMMGFETDGDYYITVGSGVISSPFGSRISYSLEAKLVDETPYELFESLPVQGNTPPASYSHYYYNIGNPPANSRLIMELYRDTHDGVNYNFYANYYPGSGDVVLAGRTGNCYAHSFAYECILSAQRQNKCLYEVAPCVLSDQHNGIYYLSAHAVFDTFYIFGDTFSNQFDSRGVYRADLVNNEFIGHSNADFTIEVRIEQMERILTNGVETPVVNGLYFIERAHYQIDVPTSFSTPIIGKTLNVAVAAYDSDLDVSITTSSPDSICDTCTPSMIIAAGDVEYFNRHQCEFEASTYYLSVSANDNYYNYWNIQQPDYGYLYSDDDCDKNEYAIHASVGDIVEIPVNLVADTVDDRITASYDSSLSLNPTENSITIEHNEYVVVSFSLNAAVGEFFSVEISQAATLPAQTYDVYLSTGSYFIPVSTSASFGMGAVDTSECASEYASSVGVVGTTVVRYIIEPCDLPEGQSTWYITLAGPSIPLKESSGIISVNIIQYANENIINVPAALDFTPITTSYTFGDIDVPFYSFRTISGLGLAGGEEIEFSVSSAAGLYVSYVSETDSSCSVTCSSTVGGTGAKTCSVYACEAISSANWYIYVDSSTLTGARTFTITRFAASVSDPTDVTILNTNVQETLTALSGTGATAEFQYFRMISSASTSSQLQLVTSGISDSNIFYYPTSATTFLPGFTASGVDVVMFNSGSTDATCGAVNPLPLPFFDCCYDDVDITFAVVGGNVAYTLESELTEYVETTTTVLSTSLTTGNVLTDKIDFITFTTNVGDNIYFDFTVTTGSARIFLNRGDDAGSANPTIPGHCWNNDGVVGTSICVGDITGSCDGMLYSCSGCETISPVQYTFAIIGVTDSDYSLQITTTPESSPVTVGLNSNLRFPVSAIADDSDSNDPFGVYSQYVFTYPGNPESVFYPLSGDFPSALDQDKYPRVQFVFSNFRHASDLSPVTGGIPVEIFINSAPAGSVAASTCLGGADITIGSGSFPCNENTGGADVTTTDVTCSLDLCLFGCNSEIYFGIARVDGFTSTELEYVFDLSVTEIYDDLVTDNLVQTLSPLVPSGSVTFNPVDTSEVIYVPFIKTGISQGQFINTVITITGDGTSTIDVRSFDVDSVCTATLASGDLICGGVITSTDTCTVRTDPCESSLDSIDAAATQTYIRFERTLGSGAWGFTLTNIVTTITAIDSSLTTLSPTGTTSYSATKFIEDFQWQFYDFFVSQNDGYTTLSVTVDNVACDTNIASNGLEVYMSWGDAQVPFAESALQNAWPTSFCNNFEAFVDPTDTITPLTSATSFGMDTCQFNAGSYKVGIFAIDGTAQFPDPLANGDSYSTLYDISATLTTLPHVVVSACEYTQKADSSFIPRIEMHVDAVTPGTVVEFTLDYDHDDDIAGDAAMYIFKNGYPRGTTATCQSDDDEDFIQNCDLSGFATSCTSTYHACDGGDGVYYIYIENVEFDDDDAFVTVKAEVFHYNTPVYDLIENDSFSVSHFVNIGDFHVYKIISDSAFSVTTKMASPDCLYNSNARVKLVPGGNGNIGDFSVDDDDGFCGDCNEGETVCDFAIDEECTFVQSVCDDLDTYYVAVGASLGETEYMLTIERLDSTPTQNIIVDQTYCTEVLQAQHFVTSLAASSSVAYTVEFTQDVAIGFYVFIGNSLDCFIIEDFCAASPCTYEISGCDFDMDSELYIRVSFDNDFTLYLDSDYTIAMNRNIGITVRSVELDVVPVSIGNPLSSAADIASITISNQWVVANLDVAHSYSVDEGIANPSAATCYNSCDFVIENSGEGTHTYYFENEAAGFELTPLAVQTISVGSSSTHTFDSDGILNFVIPQTSGAIPSYQVYIENVSYGATDGDSVADFDFRYGFGSAPSYGCGVGGTCTLFNAVPQSGCEREYLPFTISNSCDHGSNLYLSIALCTPISPCGVQFSVRVVADTQTTQLVNGVAHNSGYTPVSVTTPSDCSLSASLTNSFALVDVSDLFYVSVRNVRGGTVSVNVGDGCPNAFICDAVDNEGGFSSSCHYGLDDCEQGSMCGNESPYYEVEFVASGTGVSYEYQIITQYVSLSTSASASIYGESAHFYEITNSNTAISIDLTMFYGPALEMLLINGCTWGDYNYYEKIVCFQGTCSMYIPVESEQPGGDSLYLQIESSNDIQNVGGIYDQRTYEKETSYTVSVTRGTSNCAPAPTSGYCADVLAFNSNPTVWSFGNTDFKNEEAECLYNDLVDNLPCGMPSSECLSLVKQFACSIKFPQCSSNGYQMPVCQDLCWDLTSACGSFTGGFAAHFECDSPFYATGTNGTCVTNLPSAQADPEPFDPLAFFADNANPDAPPPALNEIDVPQFQTIIATLPPIILDDDDDFKMVEHKEEFVSDESSASNMMISMVLCISLAIVAMI